MSAREPVVLSSYSPLWPALFDYERERLARIFPEPGVRIEHVGSTAVPGLGAKPIIDVLLGVPTLALVELRLEALREDGWRYVPEFEKAFPDRRYFTRTDGQPGNYHLHAVVTGSPFWMRQLAFRDALRASPQLAADYWKLKQRLAARFPNDREAYAAAKSDFVRAALAAASGQGEPAP